METQVYVEEVEMDLTDDDFGDDCESIFHNDIREKKITGRGAFGKTSCTRSRNGGMPSDFLKGKKLREYMGNSEVKTYNLNDFNKPAKSRKQRTKITKEIEKSICELYVDGADRQGILKQYGISDNALCLVLKRNGIKPNRKPGRPSKIQVVNPETEPHTECEEFESVEQPSNIPYTEEPIQPEHSVNYKDELVWLIKKYEQLKVENEKYKTALLNLALKMV